MLISKHAPHVYTMYTERVNFSSDTTVCLLLNLEIVTQFKHRIAETSLHKIDMRLHLIIKVKYSETFNRLKHYSRVLIGQDTHNFNHKLYIFSYLGQIKK